MKRTEKKKIAVRIVCIVLAGLMVFGTIAGVIAIL